MEVRGAFNHLLRPGLRRDFRDSYDQFPEEYSQILRVGSQDRAEVEAVNVAGLPRMPSRGESEPVTYLDAVQGDKVVYVDTEFALGMIPSRESRNSARTRPVEKRAGVPSLHPLGVSEPCNC